VLLLVKMTLAVATSMTSIDRSRKSELEDVKKAKKTSPDVAHTQQPQSSAVTDGGDNSVIENNGDPNLHAASLEEKVQQLAAVVQTQQQTIDNLTRKLSFVLSYLDIPDIVDNKKGVVSLPPVDATSSIRILQQDESTTQNLTTNFTGPISYSSVLAQEASPGHERERERHDQRRGDASRPTNIREALATAMYADRRDQERRAKSVVVSGLTPRSDLSDAAIFRQLCSQEFGLDPDVVFTKRLGMNSPDRQDRVLPLLVGLKSSDEVQSIMGLAKLLRRSTVECVRNNVFY